MASLRIGVLASGRGSNLQAIIDACECGKIRGAVAVVVADKKDAYALARAEKHRIDGVFVDPAGKSRAEFDREIDRVLSAHNVDLVCLAGYMRLLGPEFVKKYYGRLMNIHPALLPSFPGLHGQRDALEHGVKVSGCTVHFVDEKTDHGPVIIQKCVPVLEGDTEKTLSERILEREHEAYPEAVRLYAEGRLNIEGRRVKIRE
jgi:phosphoribosylglycinamide formyltransferase-1